MILLFVGDLDRRSILAVGLLVAVEADLEGYDVLFCWVPAGEVFSAEALDYHGVNLDPLVFEVLDEFPGGDALLFENIFS